MTMEIEFKINDIYNHLELLKKYDVKMSEEDRLKAESVNKIWSNLLLLCKEKDQSLGNKKEIFAQKTKDQSIELRNLID